MTDAPDPPPTDDASTGAAPAADRDPAAVIVGADPDALGAALADQGVAVRRAAGTGDREALAAAGIETATLLVVTDVGLATSIPVAREINPDLTVAVYSRDSVPEFALTLADLIIDPELMAPNTVAEELA